MRFINNVMRKGLQLLVFILLAGVMWFYINWVVEGVE